MEVKSIRRQEKDFAGLLSSNVTAGFDVNEQEVLIMEMEMYWLEMESTNSHLLRQHGHLAQW